MNKYIYIPYASASVQQEESASPCCEQVPLCVAASAHNCAAAHTNLRYT